MNLRQHRLEQRQGPGVFLKLPTRVAEIVHQVSKHKFGAALEVCNKRTTCAKVAMFFVNPLYLRQSFVQRLRSWLQFLLLRDEKIFISALFVRPEVVNLAEHEVRIADITGEPTELRS